VLFDLTYNSKEINKKIDVAVGPAFGLFSKSRWQGIGSERLVITNATGQLEKIFGGRFTQNFANIEMRPGGIIIRVRYRLEVYGIIIPFGKLTLFKNNPGEVNVYGDGLKMTLRNYQGRAINQRFIQKLIEAKATYYQENHVI
jgi:hypothetical protein